MTLGRTFRHGIHPEEHKEATVGLASEMLDLEQPVTIMWNERKAFDGLPKRDFARAAGVALEKVDWRGTFEAFVELRGGK